MRTPRPIPAVALLLGAALVGCAGNGPVVRVMDGHVVAGRYIHEQAYAFFLAGALAEAQEKPDLGAALAHYLGSARVDPAEPEVWVRAARVRCRLDPNDPDADSELARALRLDASYEPARAAEAYCAKLRARGPGASDFIDDDEEAPVVERNAGPGRGADLPDDVRHRIEALTLVHADRVAAWEALAAWGMAHGDAALASRGLSGVARLAPGRRLAVGELAISLAGSGHLFAAREVAAALLDAPGDRSSGGRTKPAASLPLVARLALDSAILARDRAKVMTRSARAHLGVEIAAGRAWAMGDASMARDLVALTVRADPANAAARLVHEGAEGRAASHLVPPRGDMEGGGLSMDPEVTLPFARQILIQEGVGAARRVLTSGAGTHYAAGDALLTPLAVDLAIAGVIADDALPPDARIELAARRGELPAEADVASGEIDARHRLLGLALLHPMETAAGDLGRRLASSAAEDPLVAVALARLHLARGEPLVQGARARLESAAAADALVAAALVDVARSDGAPAALSHAKERLAGLAKTPAERARAAE